MSKNELERIALDTLERTDHLFDWLIESAMKYSELEDINSATAARMLSRAAKTVYTTEKYGKRGEFGELLLHAIIRQIFNSEPAPKSLSE